MYTDEQLKHISEELKDYITFFGYSNIGLDPKAQKVNLTSFFHYEGNKVTLEQKKQSGGYRAMNVKTLTAIGTRAKPYREFLFEYPDNNLPECEFLSSE